jgi:hypothetical protein
MKFFRLMAGLAISGHEIMIRHIEILAQIKNFPWVIGIC